MQFPDMGIRKAIQEGTFKTHKDTLKLLTGRKWSDFTSDDQALAVNHLFSLRNGIGHGKRMSHAVVFHEGKRKRMQSDHFESVRLYLEGKKLINKERSYNSPMDILSNIVIDFFAIQPCCSWEKLLEGFRTSIV